MNKMIVVTGCLGFIGSHLTEALLRNGWHVYGIDKRTYAANSPKLFEKSKNFKFIEADIATLDYLPSCDYVINTAAESHVDNSIVDATNFMNSNILGVRNLLDLIKRQPNTFEKPIFLHFSTDEVYGDTPDGKPKLETDTLSPSNPYSAAKAAADMLVFAWARTFDIPYLIIRPTNCYGVRQFPEKLIPIAVRKLSREQKIKLHDNGAPYRNWLNVSDLVNAILLLINKQEKNKIYNISANFELRNIEVVKNIIDIFFENNVLDIVWSGIYGDYIDFGYSRKGQDVRYCVNTDKIESLGWRPKKVFSDELRKVVEYYIDEFFSGDFRW